MCSSIEKVREVAIKFLEFPLKVQNRGILYIYYPYASYTRDFVSSYDGSIYEKRFEDWKVHMADCINGYDSKTIYSMIENPFKMQFYLSIYFYLTFEERGRMWGDIWHTIKGINRIAGVDDVYYNLICSMFEDVPNNFLMDEEELGVLNSFDEITVYRGVDKNNQGNKKGLSWTLCRDTADWYSGQSLIDRSLVGEVWMLKVPKEYILCYFKEGEEVIIDTRGLWHNIVVI